MSEMLKVKDVAARLNISPGHVYELVDRKLIGVIRTGLTGRGYRFTEEIIADFIERNTSQPQAAKEPTVKPAQKRVTRLNLQHIKIRSSG